MEKKIPMTKIYLEPVGGLCNRLRSIASTVQISKANVTNSVTIFWRLNRELNCPFEYLFEPIHGIKVKSVKQIDVIAHFIQRVKREVYWDEKIIKNSRENLELPANMLDKLKDAKDAYLISCDQFSRELDFSIFRPQKDIEMAVNQLTYTYDKNLVGVHIRRTDNIESIKKSSTDSFIKKMQEEIMINKDTYFYLATDSYQEEITLKKIFGNRIIAQENKALNRNSEMGIRCALIDLLCLSRTKKIYGSYYSSFSEVAASLGNINLHIIE
jgi:hypothetical protein